MEDHLSMMEVITMLSWKTWEPYIIRYPNPCFAARNSPMITPTKQDRVPETHITNGNKNEERLVSIVGGTVIETESERLMCMGAAKMVVKLV